LRRTALWAYVAVTGVVAAATGVVANLITDRFSWAMLTLFVVLVVAGIGLAGIEAVAARQAGRAQPAVGEPGPDDADRDGRAASAVGRDVNLNVNVASGEGRIVQKFAHGLGGAWLVAMLSIVLTIAAAIVIAVVYRYSDDGPVGRRARLNPYGYLSFQVDDPAQQQKCPGLFGLCVNHSQPLSAAEEVFAPVGAGELTEPSWQPGQRCRQWDLGDGLSVSVCETTGQISRIQVSLPPRMEVAFAVYGGVLRFPMRLTQAADQVRTIMYGARPFDISELAGEGFILETYAWHYLGVEGVVTADITLVGQRTLTQGRFNLTCDYNLAQRQFKNIDVIILSIDTPAPRLDKKPDCPS
jgi:hypothetical protein